MEYYRLSWRTLALAALVPFLPFALGGQTTDTLPPIVTEEEEEDYSLYETATFAETGAKRYCNPKILDISPVRFVWAGYDWQLPYELEMSAPGNYATDADFPGAAERADVRGTGGFRIMANIPVISRNELVWSVGGQAWQVRYPMEGPTEISPARGVLRTLRDRGLLTMGLNTTVFKPLGEETFGIVQLGADLNGDYTLADFQSLEYLRYSWSVLWGRRPDDRKQWGVGLSSNYRAGQWNFIPIVLFNWTAPNRLWGVEMLLPARAVVRRTFNPRNLLTVGYELEGQTYRLGNISSAGKELELRRSEVRGRLEYQHQLTGFIWLTAQAGMRFNWIYNIDSLEGNRDFFRGFFGDQPYAILGRMDPTPYFTIGVCVAAP